jgi:hypothetical protein
MQHAAAGLLGCSEQRDATDADYDYYEPDADTELLAAGGGYVAVFMLRYCYWLFVVVILLVLLLVVVYCIC